MKQHTYTLNNEESSKAERIASITIRLESIKAKQAHIKSLPNMPNLFSSRQTQDDFMHSISKTN